MTLDEIRASEKEYLTPEDVRKVLGCSQYAINVQAKKDPSRLGFPVCVMGTRVRIPRLGFLYWVEYGTAPIIAERR